MSSFMESVLSLTAAFVLGAIIGAERQYRQRNAGLRTNVLVAIATAAFADLGMRLWGHEGAVRIVAYIVSGIGFLGAGVIMKEGTNVRGLNTAATLWCSAAVGALCGSDMQAEAILLTVFVLAGNTLLRPLGNYINRIPIDERAMEAEYKVHVVCPPAEVADVRGRLAEVVEAHGYPVRETRICGKVDDDVEIAATLVSNAVEPGDLDRVTDTLEKDARVKNATWTMTTST